MIDRSKLELPTDMRIYKCWANWPDLTTSTSSESIHYLLVDVKAENQISSSSLRNESCICILTSCVIQETTYLCQGFGFLSLRRRFRSVFNVMNGFIRLKLSLEVFHAREITPDAIFLVPQLRAQVRPKCIQL